MKIKWSPKITGQWSAILMILDMNKVPPQAKKTMDPFFHEKNSPPTTEKGLIFDPCKGDCN